MITVGCVSENFKAVSTISKSASQGACFADKSSQSISVVRSSS